MISSQLLTHPTDSITGLLNEIRMIDQNSPELIRSNEWIVDDRDICLYKIKKLSYDEKYPMREAFENILMTVDNDAFNLIYIIDGNDSGISVYIGIVKKQGEKSSFSAGNYGNIIRKSFESNYNGSVLERITNDSGRLNDILLEASDRFRDVGCIVGIPGANESDTVENVDFQGIDRLINTMLGSCWRMIVVCEPVQKSEITSIQRSVYDIYDKISVYSKSSLQHSVNSGESRTDSTSDSITRGKNKGINENHGSNKGSANSSGTSNSGTNESRGTSSGTSYSKTIGASTSTGTSSGTSSAMTIELSNKQATEIMKYIDEELLPRLSTGYSRGMYRTSISYMSTTPADTVKLKAGILSLFRGDKPSFSTLTAVPLSIPQNADKARFLNCFTGRKYIKDGSNDSYVLNCRPISESCAYLSTYLTPKEVSVIASLPQKEVPGLVLSESVEFGLNEKDPGENKVSIGKIMQRGRKLEIPFELDRNMLNKHTFVAGVTGSGKTTTCHRLLKEARMPFLVIEPAKTEYRALLNSGDFDDIVIFTLGNENVAPFRFNPFELVDGEQLSAHIDTMKAAFTSAFPMEASMPQLLEEAMIRCYEKRGWLIGKSQNRYYPTREELDAHKDEAYPILSELMEAMNEVVKEKHFGNELQGNYIGSLVSRLSNLTVGSKGSMLNCNSSVDFDYIIHHNVIIEMDEMKAPEDKALIMGFLLMRLSAAIRNEHRIDPDFRHITLVEEAHRLLSRPDYGDSGAKRSAVETFADMLAEVRKYGEGLVIADQIPNKLAPEVLKNTNTKIIHKLLARDDKDAVGDTMLMDDKQKEYLSALLTGQAVVFSENTEKPVHVAIDRLTDTNAAEVEDEQVRNSFLRAKDQLGKCYDDMIYSDLLPLLMIVIKQASKTKYEDNSGIEELKRSIESYGLDLEKAIEILCRIFYRKAGKIISHDQRLYEKNLSTVTEYIIQCCKENSLISNPDIRKLL